VVPSAAGVNGKEAEAAMAKTETVFFNIRWLSKKVIKNALNRTSSAKVPSNLMIFRP
jgi:hypothetical protein